MKRLDKEIYQDKICNLCINNKTCNHQSLFVSRYQDKVTMRCGSYKYIKNYVPEKQVEAKIENNDNVIIY